MSNNNPIGLFDSGIGGTSIWKEIHDLLPNENTIYLADSKNAPYGQKSKEEIIQLSIKNTEYLLNKNCKIIFYSPKHKLKCCDIVIEHKSKCKYRQNKNLGIVHTRALLKTHKDFFEKHKKKDDLADCFLQALSYNLFFNRFQN